LADCLVFEHDQTVTPLLDKSMARVPFDRFRRLVLLLMGMIAVVLIVARLCGDGTLR